jgi:hypothetical protein
MPRGHDADPLFHVSAMEGKRLTFRDQKDFVGARMPGKRLHEKLLENDD